MTRRDATILFISGVTCGATVTAVVESIKESIDSRPRIDPLPKQVQLLHVDVDYDSYKRVVDNYPLFRASILLPAFHSLSERAKHRGYIRNAKYSVSGGVIPLRSWFSDGIPNVLPMVVYTYVVFSAVTLKNIYRLTVAFEV